MRNWAVDVSARSIRLNPLTDFDKQAINFSTSRQFKEIYGSFILFSSDDEIIRGSIPGGVKLIPRIETAKVVSNACEILESSDAVLIDRGNLSREISILIVPITVNSILSIAKKWTSLFLLPQHKALFRSPGHLRANLSYGQLLIQ